MKKRFVLAVGLVAASSIASPLLAGQHSADAQHSARVLHAPSAASLAAVETDYESRSVESSRFGRLGPHRQNLAIASFGSNTAAAGTTLLVTYFNFNNPFPASTFSNPPGFEPTPIIINSGSATFPATGTTTNQATLDATGAGQAMEFAFPGLAVGVAQYQFSVTTPGMSNFSLSLATKTTLVSDPIAPPFSSITASQTLSYSTDGGTTFLPLGSVAPSADFQTTTLSLPTGGASVIIRDDLFFFGNGPASSATFDIDNIQFTGDVAAVPEPATWFGAALAVAAVGWMQRRRLLAVLGLA